MRLIDADALKNEVDNFQNCYNGWSDTYDKAYIIEAIEEAPTIDAIPKGKLIEAIKAKDFVDELIGYIFAYPDDDYMTMECLCRKLHKYGLIEKKDGEWTTDFIDRKDESNSEIPNNSTISKMEQVDKDINVRSKTEPQIYGNEHNCIMTLFGDCSYAETGCGSCEVVEKVRKALDKYEPKDEPQTDCH